MMIRLKDIINEDSKAGWGSDPNKPRKVAAIENKTRDLLASWKRGFRPGWENSPRIARLRNAMYMIELNTLLNIIANVLNYISSPAADKFLSDRT